jgi:serine/threonine protein kinase/Tol biopolymer transport system component
MSPHQSIAHYRITTKLGAGGMGEVWRATDTKLNRDVAIKLLPETFAADPDRLARFSREAQVLASLNHPNIAAIYGVEDRALILELVEGETLQLPISLTGALDHARQIAEALEYAHEKGVIHRDLKPANIKITPEGKVKVLDFGLAKALSPESPAAGDAASSPTLTMRATQMGTIMGTAAYMSPEQAAGKPVDRRADIWSFGVVLWEMLNGHRLFEAETVSHTLADVLRAEIDFSKLPAETPLAVRELLRRCLDRNVKDRLRDIGEARIILQNTQPAEPAAAPAVAPSRNGRLWPAIASLLLLATVALGYLAYRHVNEEPRLLRLSVLPPEYSGADMPAISPDGRRIVFIATQEGQSGLWVRELESLSARYLEGTGRASLPFWSPDSRAIAFFQSGKLKKIDAAGGPALTLCDAPLGRGGSWGKEGVIVFVPGIGTGIFRVPAVGGPATPVTSVDRASGENAHRMPLFLPDGRHFLYTARNNDAEKHTIYLADLNSKDRRRVLTAASNAQYSPPGFLLFMRGQTLMAQAFPASTAQVEGEPVPLASQVRFDSLNLAGRFSVSQSGVLLYLSGPVGYGGAVEAQLTWFDRSGTVTGRIGQPAIVQSPSISPDGRTVAFARTDQTGHADIWLYDMARGTESRFTFESTSSQMPVWSPDGSHIAYTSIRPGVPLVVVKKPVGGTGETETVESLNAQATDWSRDGRYIMAQVVAPKTNVDIWVLPQFGDRKPFPYIHTDFAERMARLSPNGRWLAYQSDETTRDEIYVQTFPTPGGKWQVSTNGGTQPVWSRDGKQLFFLDLERKMTAVEIGSGERFQAGVPKTLFPTRFVGSGLASWFDVSKDGRFLIPNQVGEAAAGVPINVVINWTAGLKK